MNEVGNKISGILPILPYDDPAVLAQQLRLQEMYDARKEMVLPMRRKLERLATKEGRVGSAAVSETKTSC